LKGHILELAKHEQGTVILQKIIDDADPEKILTIASEISGHILELFKDSVGK